MRLEDKVAVVTGSGRGIGAAIAHGYASARVTKIVQGLIRKGGHHPEKLEARIPAGTMGEVEDLVGSAVFLASNESDYVTGTTLIVNGGWLANGYTKKSSM